MRTTTKFRLDDPTRIKWDQYIALIPQIDEIMRDNEIELLTRCTEENDYSVEEVFDYKNEHQFTALVVTLNQLVNKANLFFTLLKRDFRLIFYKTIQFNCTEYQSISTIRRHS